MHQDGGVVEVLETVIDGMLDMVERLGTLEATLRMTLHESIKNHDHWGNTQQNKANVMSYTMASLRQRKVRGVTYEGG